MKRTLFILLALALLVGCQSTSPAVEPTPTNTAQPAAFATSTTIPTATTTPTQAPTATAEPTATSTPIPQDYGPNDFPADVNPLTGLPVADPSLLDRLPVALKIQTFPRGQRPPWAISLADIVYDYYQNNGLTRLYAIFLTHDAEQVGPIRSARMFDGTLTRMYKSIFTFGGADQRILNRLLNAEYADRLVLEGSNICPAMCRIEPATFNYLVGNTEELRAHVEERGVDNTRQNLDGMRFEYEPPSGGEPAEQVFVRYSISSYTRWDYDPESGRYLRFQDTQEDTGQGEAYEPFLDRSTGEQVAADNLVVLHAIHEYVFKSGNSEIIDILVSGSGKAVLFRNGQAYHVNWSRPTLEALITLTDTAGNPFPFKPGNTWFQVVGESSRELQPETNAWRYEMRIP